LETGNAENISQDQRIASPPENMWLAGAFVVTSLIGVALYAGLLIRVVVIDGDMTRALGGLMFSSLAAYAATSGRRPPAGVATLIVLTAISSSIAMTGFISWDELVVARRVAEQAPRHPDEIKLTGQAIGLPIESPIGALPSGQSLPPTKSSIPATSNSKSEDPGLMAALIREWSEGQIQKATAHDSAVNRLGLDAIWEPENLLSPAKLKEDRRKMAAYLALTSRMEQEYDAEIKRRNKKILSLAGTRDLSEFKRQMASSQNDVRDIFRLQTDFAITSIELIEFFDQQVRRQTSVFRDGMFEFANQVDQDRYDFLIGQLEDQETQIANLQGRILQQIHSSSAWPVSGSASSR